MPSPGISALAGATGAAISALVTYPLNTIATILQVDESERTKGSTSWSILTREATSPGGFAKLYKGLDAFIIAQTAAQGVYFCAYSYFQTIAEGHHITNTSKDVLVSSAAGVVAVFVSNPLWVINTRLATCKEEGRTMKDEITHLLRDEGPMALYRGLIPALMLISNPVVVMVVFEWLQRQATRVFDHKTTLLVFVLSAIAKLVATICTYPLLTLKAKQFKDTTNQLSGKSTFVVLYSVLKLHGLSGLYKGLDSKLNQTILNTALMFALKFRIETLLESWLKAGK